MINSIIQALKKQLDSFNHDIDGSNSRYISVKIKLDSPTILAIPDTNEAFFISKPETGFSLLGFGSFLSINASGHNRFNIIKSEYNSILDKWCYFEHSTAKDIPIAFMSFAFNENDKMIEQWQGLPNTTLIIPELLLRKENGEQTLIANFRLDERNQSHYFDRLQSHLSCYFEQDNSISSSEPPTDISNVSMCDDWLQLSQQALSEINSGHFEKLVISRKVSWPLATAIDTGMLLEKLKQHYPSCTLLQYRHADTTIIAASPENLLTLQHPFIQSNAIGGTVLRKTPQTLHKDCVVPSQLGHSLLSTGNDSTANRKLLKEHFIIAQDIYQRLDPLCQSLKMPVSPVLMKLHNLYHLETPIQGRLMSHYDIFDVINSLHPTPAVAGFPVDTSRQWVVENENYHRGWYTGAFGWLDGQKNGEFSVLLRCALVKDNEINLFAGAGLVAESDPELEWYETETKIQTILEML